MIQLLEMVRLIDIFRFLIFAVIFATPLALTLVSANTSEDDYPINNDLWLILASGLQTLIVMLLYHGVIK